MLKCNTSTLSPNEVLAVTSANVNKILCFFFFFFFFFSTITISETLTPNDSGLQALTYFPDQRTIRESTYQAFPTGTHRMRLLIKWPVYTLRLVDNVTCGRNDMKEFVNHISILQTALNGFG